MGSGCKFCIGEIVTPPFEVGHTDTELCELSKRLRDLDSETRVVMEATGNYLLPAAGFLYDSGFFVSVVNAMLVLKSTYRQYQQCAKVQTMLKNNLTSLLDTAIPDANRLFTSPARADSSEK